MRKPKLTRVLFVLASAIVSACTSPAYEPDGAQGTDPVARVAFDEAVAALGGAGPITAVESIVMEATGGIRNLGQNRTPEDENPAWEIASFLREIDPAGRMRTREVREARFLYAGATTQRRDEGIDGMRGFRAGDTVSPLSAEQSAAIRREFLHHPLTLARAALDTSSTFRSANTNAIDIVLESGERLTLEVDPETRLPLAIRSDATHPNLGDVTIRTEFSDYADVEGVQLPHRIRRTVDRFVELELDISAHRLDAATDIPSPGAAAAPPPGGDAFAVTVGVERVADGIWWLHGSGNHRSVLFEFDDHLTLFEVPSSEARSQAVITTARTLVPDKPLTEAIVSHHHFDHSAGLRVAVASGLTIITHRSNVEFFEELVSRPHTRAPDILQRFPREMNLVAVDDAMVLEDPSRRVELYHVVDNPREGTNIFAWVPGERILVQADLYDSGWVQHPWAANFRENLRARGLDVARHVPVHGTIQSDDEVLETLRARGADLN